MCGVALLVVGCGGDETSEVIARVDNSVLTADEFYASVPEQLLAVMSLDDQEEALTMSDRIAVMHNGRVLQVGSPTEIYEKPQSRFVADFIGETNFLDGVVQEQEGDLATVLVDGALPIVAQTPNALQPGTAVTVAVRPEKISLATGAVPDGQNAFPGRVEQVVYVGTDTRYRVRLSDHVSLVVREQNIVSTTDPVSHHMNNDRPLQARWQYTGGRILLD